MEEATFPLSASALDSLDGISDDIGPQCPGNDIFSSVYLWNKDIKLDIQIFIWYSYFTMF